MILQNHIRTILLVALLALGGAARGESADARKIAQTLFRTLTGTPLPLDDPRLALMVERIEGNFLPGAAAIATNDENFFNVTVRHFASHLSVRDEFQDTPLNDFIAMVVGHTAEPDADARELLTGDFWYRGTLAGLPAHSVANNDHFEALDRSRVPLRQYLVRVSPQRAGVPGAGLLTSRTWAKEHLSAGTNRRAVEFAFREFMCTPIKSLMDTTTPRHRIRRDVHRNPGGSTAVFDTKCAGCHGILDGLGGAFAYYDFVFTDAMVKKNGYMVYADSATFPGLFNGAVARKMNQNAGSYPEGYVTFDDSWENFARYNQNESFGWRSPPMGNGVAEFGALLANSEGFSRCMATRVYSQLCLKKDFNPDRLSEHHLVQLEASQEQIQQLATSFENNGYRLKQLFEEAAVLPKCLNR